MLGHYVRRAGRQLTRSPLFSAITVLGLAVGMAACLLILHHVGFERSFDRFHDGWDRVYRLRYERTTETGESVRFASCCPPAAPLIRDGYPEVEGIARIFRYRAVMARKDRQIRFTEERLFFAEPQIASILRFTMLAGDSLAASDWAGRVFLSRSAARRFFGDEDPLGRPLTLDGRADYRVAGVFADAPPNAHLKCDFLLPFRDLEQLFGADVLAAWGHTGFFTYLRMRPGADPAGFERKLAGLVDAHAGELMKAYNLRIELKLQPLAGIHLDPPFMQELEPGGDAATVRALLIIAVFVLAMAWVNYVNLTTARALMRAREVGLRKVVGASRAQLAVQFFVENLALNALAAGIAFALYRALLPSFAELTGTPAGYRLWADAAAWPLVPALFAAGVFASGIYPVLALSAFQPAAVLRDQPGRARGAALRKALVVFQFVATFVLATASLAVYHQVAFLKDRDLGFDRRDVLVLPAPRVRGDNFQAQVAAFKEELARYPAVRGACVGTEVPGRQIRWDAGAIRRAGEDPGRGKNYQIVGVDYDYLDLLGFRIVHGRGFSREFPADERALVPNETATRWLGFARPADAVGQPVDYWGDIFTIVGVVRDHHQQSPKQAVEPHLFRLMPYGRDLRGVFAVKMQPGRRAAAMRQVERSFRAFFPGNPYEYFLLEDYYDEQFRGDERAGAVVGLFTLLALLVNALGIFGLAAFMAVQRTREIGIRKVLGASTGRITMWLTGEFLLLVGVGFVVAAPVAALGVRLWLEGFAVRAGLAPWLFLLPLAVVAAVTVLTVGTHVLRVAATDPAAAIKHQ